MHNKAMKGAKVLEYFTTQQWKFESNNIASLIESQSAEDRVVNMNPKLDVK
jgi:fatty acyl-CoA reductase